MNWRPADDPGPRYEIPQAMRDEMICCLIEADILLSLGDWDVPE